MVAILVNFWISKTKITFYGSRSMNFMESMQVFFKIVVPVTLGASTTLKVYV